MRTASQKASVAVVSFLTVGVMFSQSVVLYVFAQPMNQSRQCTFEQINFGNCFPPPDPNRDWFACKPGETFVTHTWTCYPASPTDNSSTTTP